MMYPKLHNASWPGLVGKGPGTPEPVIGLDEMIDLTVKAEVDGRKFDGLDLFLASPHVDIDSSDDDLARLADKLRANGLNTGSFVAPIWAGSAMGGEEARKTYLTMVEKACKIAQKLTALGVRPDGVVRVDSSCSVADWAKDPAGNFKQIVATFQEAATIAEGYGERLAAEGEICWGGMHSWKWMLRTLEAVGRPGCFGMQVDLAHTMLYLLGYNAEEDRILPADFAWGDQATFQACYKQLVAALKPWVFDFHVAQNDGTVKGQGSHDKTGRHCLPNDPNGKLDIAWCAKQWLCDENGQPTKACRHLCWDGCMFTNEVMMMPDTWNSILSAMLEVQKICGWEE
ncbi:MAG: TIM barrel protein [Kiritimatiellae bacterium]|nr:TIM barrel protein [Kiritimatiellia bacterium]